MTVYLFDGSSLICEEIEIGNGTIIADGYRVISQTDIIRITQN